MVSTTAPPLFASSRLKRLALPGAQLLSLVAALSNSSCRSLAAAELAWHVGADDLLVFVADRDFEVLLPAVGFRQTLPRATDWQQFLRRCVSDSFHQSELAFPHEGSVVHVTGIAAGRAVLVLLGGVPDMDAMIDMSLLLPLLAAVFTDEHEAQIAAAQTTLAREAASQARLLAASLDRARSASRAALSEARRANAAKDRFLAVLSHELRTPLNPVLMAASAMEMDPHLPPEIRADISMIRRNVELEANLHR